MIGMSFPPSGEPGEDQMRAATWALAQYLDLMATTAKLGSARPRPVRGVRGVDIIAAVERGRSGGQETGLAHVPELLTQLGLSLPDTPSGDRPWREPSLPGGRFFTAEDSPLWHVGSRVRSERFGELASSPTIPARNRLAALTLVPPEHFQDPLRERLSAARDEAQAAADAGRSSAPARRTDDAALDELTTITTDLAADSLARHLEWAAAGLMTMVEQGNVYRIGSAVAEHLNGLYAHHRYATWWCDQLLHPTDAQAVHGPFEAARLALTRPKEGPEDATNTNPGEGQGRGGTTRGRGRGGPDGPGGRRS